MTEERDDKQGSGEDRPSSFPVWKRAVLILAAASVSLGFALRRYETTTVPDDSQPEVALSPSTSSTSSPDAPGVLPRPPGGVPETQPMAELSEFAGPSSFGPGLPPNGAPTPSATVEATQTAQAPATPAQVPATHWSPLFMKGGLSIFVGLCIGHALRAFLKLSMIALGLVFMVMLGLQYSGLLEIDWSAAGGLYDDLAVKVAGELESLRAFVAGSLPSAGLGTIGLIAGFKRSG